MADSRRVYAGLDQRPASPGCSRSATALHVCGRGPARRSPSPAVAAATSPSRSGMVGAMTGIAGAVTDLVAGDPGLLGTRLRGLLAFAGAADRRAQLPEAPHGLSPSTLCTPRSPAPPCSPSSASSGSSPTTDSMMSRTSCRRCAWAWLGRVLLGPNPLPARPKTHPPRRSQPTQPQQPEAARPRSNQSAEPRKKR